MVTAKKCVDAIVKCFDMYDEALCDMDILRVDDQNAMSSKIFCDWYFGNNPDHKKPFIESFRDSNFYNDTIKNMSDEEILDMVCNDVPYDVFDVLDAIHECTEILEDCDEIFDKVIKKYAEYNEAFREKVYVAAMEYINRYKD